MCKTKREYKWEEKVRYYFDWDPNKAKTNRKKHGIGFEQASTIFLDPGMMTVFDSENNEQEDRWATIGIDRDGILLVVVHTFQQLDPNCCKIRIISARKATGKESKQYQEENK
jgi:uncharacterized DUF497 family protein